MKTYILSKPYVLTIAILLATFFKASAQDDGCIVLESECYTIKYAGVIKNTSASPATATLSFTVTAKCEVDLDYLAFELPGGVIPISSSHSNSDFEYAKSHDNSPGYYALKYTATGASGFKTGQSDSFHYTILLSEFNTMVTLYTTVSGGGHTFTVCLDPKACGVERDLPEPVCYIGPEDGIARFGFVDAVPLDLQPDKIKIRFRVDNLTSSPLDRVIIEIAEPTPALTVVPTNSQGLYSHIYFYSWFPPTMNKIITYRIINNESSPGLESDIFTLLMPKDLFESNPAFQLTMHTKGGDMSHRSTTDARTCEVEEEEPLCAITVEPFTFIFDGATESGSNSTLNFRIKNDSESAIDFFTFEVPDGAQPLTAEAPDGFFVDVDEESGFIAFFRIDGETAGGETVNFSIGLPTENHDLNPYYTISAFAGINFGGTGFNTITCDDTPIEPLPVELSSFNGKSTASGIELAWTTASEKDNDFFEVQRSADGREYTTISKVKGAGNSSTSLRYSYLDNSAPKGTVYYRIKQVDFDGTSSLSKMIAIESNGAQATAALSIYPNPATNGNVSIALGGSEISNKTFAVIITDMNGRKVLEQQMSTSAGNEINIKLDQAKFAKGLYMVKVQGDNILETKRLIVQ